jgi:phosphate transport system permease protein
MATVLGTPIALPPHDPSDDLRRSETVGVRWRTGFDRAMGYLLPLLFLVAIVPILDLVYFISAKAVPTLTVSVLTSYASYDSHDALAVPIVTTFEWLAVATLIAVALGLFGGIATAEFLSERSAGWVRMSANLLAGMPSVIIGYFGFFVFVIYFGWGGVFIAGALTLAFFMTPYIFRTADLAFSSIPRPIREAALGTGAKPVQYIVRVGTPIAFPQILTGVFLAMAIGLGETAPIVLTVLPSVLVPTNLFSPATYLTYLIWTGFSSPPGSVGLTLAYQAAFLIVVAVVVLNIVVRIISARFRRRLAGLYQ